MDDVSPPRPAGRADPGARAAEALLRRSVALPSGRPAGTRNKACRHLMAADPDLATLIRRVGPCRLQADKAREPFESLIRAIAHQQLHARAAEAILGRLLALCPGPAFPTPEVLLALPDEALRGCGVSGAKAASMRGVCAARLAGVVPTRAQAVRLSDAALVERLVPLRGIGRWTVEMLLIFGLGRPDVMPVDDWAVREGYRLVKRLAVQPKPRALAEVAAGWSPHRSAAAWYLWRAADAAKPASRAPPG